MKKAFLSIFSPFVQGKDNEKIKYNNELLSEHKLRNSGVIEEEIEYCETEKALHILLNELESVENDYPEIYSKQVTVQMREAILSSFIFQQDGYIIPQRFGLCDDDGNQTLHLALGRYVERASELAIGLNITTKEGRLEMFQDKTVLSFKHKTVDIFFGWIELEN